MNIVQKLDRFSFKKIIGATALLIMVLAIPVTVWVSQQETRLASRAEFEKPALIKPVTRYGPLSPGEPRINLVWPFLGKVGDAVLIEGENFGDNPENKQLSIGNVAVGEDKINRWTPNLIEFIVPQNSFSSSISLTVGGKKASWPYLFTVYSLNTKIQVTENNDIVTVLNAPEGSILEIHFSDGEKTESTNLNATLIPADKVILTVLVKDKNNNPLPFFVEPEEFNF